MQDMEQTGHGIMSKDEIDFNLDNRFTNLARECIYAYACYSTDIVVGKVLADCPWYYEIKVLIGQRPNLQPIGLGNSRTPINESVFRHGRARKVNEDDAEHGNDGHDASSSDGSTSDSGDDDAPRQQAERVVDLISRRRCRNHRLRACRLGSLNLSWNPIHLHPCHLPMCCQRSLLVLCCQSRLEVGYLRYPWMKGH